MVSEIRIYVEGDPALRRGFHSFLQELRELARRKNVRWSVITCGSRNFTYYYNAISFSTQRRRGAEMTNAR
jgi:hypothetical protein